MPPLMRTKSWRVLSDSVEVDETVFFASADLVSRNAYLYMPILNKPYAKFRFLRRVFVGHDGVESFRVYNASPYLLFKIGFLVIIHWRKN